MGANQQQGQQLPEARGFQSAEGATEVPGSGRWTIFGTLVLRETLLLEPLQPENPETRVQICIQIQQFRRRPQARCSAGAGCSRSSDAQVLPPCGGPHCRLAKFSPRHIQQVT
jgi:hypothetical protein